ncbi:late secretory pathway protein avl9 [Cadophora gregata]|uniref:late secretory pathway protein avl9 n=1 Tax=Cadophora gregata TaxID=51156 RepID=UPI0026DBA2DD|nr:late secretory pathway protein avl9 [Cadophora gregata]KAK0129131.1 late secretory pathway protein avl9 [Cadophora gregata]
MEADKLEDKMENIDLDAPTPKENEIPAAAVEPTPAPELVAGSGAPVPAPSSEAGHTSTVPVSSKESNGIPTPAPAKNGTAGNGVGNGFVPLVTVVGFHHARGPEVESWFGAPEGVDPAVDNEWPLLPFMALSDGAHVSTEDFSYFTLLRPAHGDIPSTSLFGISCTRQMDASALINRPADVTRSTVQKAVVVIADSPQFFGMLRERLSVVTKAWFAQREFTDTEILKRFQESLQEEKERGVGQAEEDREEYLGMSLRELVREFKAQTLVLFKCCLLQPKMLFFGSRCERLCMMQFSLISLIPGLIRNLQDCADPDMDAYERHLTKPTSLKTSDRSSLLSYMGLPLQIFGKGSLFGPYTPLQQLDILADYGTKSYIVGSTNSLLLQQKDRYSDILINLDNTTITITSSSLRSALALSVADRRWIDFITQSVNDTWDDANPGRPKTMGYVGSEEFIRLQFEEYLLSLISAVKCHNYLQHHANNPKVMLPHVEGDPAHDFGIDWVEAWSRSENYRIWDRYTDSHLFDIVEPKHPCAGGLTIEDVQRRMMEQVKEYKLDERFATGKEVLGRNLQAGREKASTAFNKLYADIEARREAQRKKYEEQRREAEKNGTALPSPGFTAPDLNGAKQTVQSVGSKAGAYIGSWGTWMGEKRKTGWGRSPSTSAAQRKEKETVSTLPIRQLGTAGEKKRPEPIKTDDRPKTMESYEESLFDAEHTSPPKNFDATASSVKRKSVPPPPETSPRKSISKPHPSPRAASKFHEEMDDNGPAAAPVNEEHQVWGEERKGKEETEGERRERSSAVAGAVVEATKTPISP